MAAEVWLGLVLSTLIALVAYFFNKWLALLEKDIENTQDSVKLLKKSIDLTRDEFSKLRNDVKEEIKDHPQIKAIFGRMDSLEKVKEFFKSEAIPQMQEAQVAFGKITHIEKRTTELENKLSPLIKAMEQRAQKK
jgi:predicted  nucleic acid-binding Zn-ribbon protein